MNTSATYERLTLEKHAVQLIRVIAGSRENKSAGNESACRASK